MLKPRYQHDMVRAGIGLYGSCMPEMNGALQHAQTLSDAVPSALRPFRRGILSDMEERSARSARRW